MMTITLDDICLRSCVKGGKAIKAPDLLGRILGDVEFEELTNAIIATKENDNRGAISVPSTAQSIPEIYIPSDDEEE
jgi:hypothetical protein